MMSNQLRLPKIAVRGLFALGGLLVLGWCPAAMAVETGGWEAPGLVTNLFQLRRCADLGSPAFRPFRISAEVLDVDSASGVLALGDSSGVEFLKLDLGGR